MDSLVLEFDLKWFNDNLQTIIQNVWPGEIPTGPLNLDKKFITFSTNDDDFRLNKESLNGSAIGQSTPTQTALALENLDFGRDFIISQINMYNEKFGKSSISVMPTDNVILHVMNIHRKITQTFK